MTPVKRISLKAAIPPPFYNAGDPATSSADFSQQRGYDVYESSDGSAFYVIKSQKVVKDEDGNDVKLPMPAENGVIKVPASHVLRCEYLSLAESPLAKMYGGTGGDPEADAPAEVKRGPGRPRKDTLNQLV